MTLRAPLQTRIERVPANRSLQLPAGDLLLTTLKGLDTFFGPPGYGPDYDFPNPRGRSYHASLQRWEQANLLMTTLQPALPAPFHQNEWPVPRGYVPAIELRTFVDASEVWLFGTDKFFGLPGMGPDYDFPNPRGRTHHASLQRWEVGNQLLTTLSQLATLPFRQLDWPVPKAQQPAISLRTWLDPVRQHLIGQDEFYGGPGGGGPGYEFDMPVRGRQIQQPAQALNRLPLLLSVRPFNQSEWPVPRGAVPSIELRTFINPMEMQLIGQDTFYGPPGYAPDFDWPNPRGRGMPTSVQRMELSNLLLSTLAPLPPPPFYQSDWPVPPGPRASIQLRTWTDTLRQQLIGKDVFFGAPGQPPANLDWPVPKGRPHPISLLQWQQQHLLSGVLNPVGPAPFFQSDWPVPKGRQPAIVLATWLDPLRIHLIGKDTFFAEPGRAPVYDWPNPRGYTYAIALRQEAHWITPLYGSGEPPFVLGTRMVIVDFEVRCVEIEPDDD